jgi:hypothetical protein
MFFCLILTLIGTTYNLINISKKKIDGFAKYFQDSFVIGGLGLYIIFKIITETRMQYSATSVMVQIYYGHAFDNR